MFKVLSKLRLSCLKRLASDKTLVEQLYKSVYGHLPDLIHPRTFDEKLQWYKLYYRKPIMTQLADKFRVREYVTQKGLGPILNELCGVYDRVDQIDLASLPDAFVLKATHGSGMNLICKSQRDFNWNAGRRKLRRWLKQDHFRGGREWAYKDIPPKIICERYLENGEYRELIDYKFYCFGGQPEVVFVYFGRFGPGGVKNDGYDMSWNRMPVRKGHPTSGLTLDRPRPFAEMVEVAKKLSAGFPFVRVDLYLVKDQIIFGEMTFYPAKGILPFSPPAYNHFFGDLFVLPDSRRICHAHPTLPEAVVEAALGVGKRGIHA